MKKIFYIFLTIFTLNNAFPMQSTTAVQQPPTTSGNTRSISYNELRKLKSQGYFKKNTRSRATESLKRKAAAKKAVYTAHKKQAATEIGSRKCNWALVFALLAGGSLIYTAYSRASTVRKNTPVITHTLANGVKQECTLTDNTFLNCKWTNATTGQELYSGSFTMNFNGTCNPNMTNAANNTQIFDEMRSANFSSENSEQPMLPSTFPKSYHLMQELYNHTNHTATLPAYFVKSADNIAFYNTDRKAIYTGLWNITDDSFAGILGHEIAHMIQKVDISAPFIPAIIITMLDIFNHWPSFSHKISLILDNPSICKGAVLLTLSIAKFITVEFLVFFATHSVARWIFRNFLRLFFDFEINADLLSATITKNGTAFASFFESHISKEAILRFLNSFCDLVDAHPQLSFRCAALQEFSQKYATLMAQAAQAIKNLGH